MSSGRNIKIELEIHAITCPGVWLCQNSGDIELSIHALGYTFSAKPLKPRFPLCYHEKFIMNGYFSDVNDFAELEKALDEEQIKFCLWQKGRRLAYYVNKLGVILNYTGCMNKNFAVIDNAIIMTRGSCFPGAISPKIEYTASIQYITKCMKCNRTVHSHSNREKRVKNLYENGVNKILHSKPVCHVHTKPRHRWRHNDNISTLPCTQMLPGRSEKNAYFLTGYNIKTSHDNATDDATAEPANCGHSRSEQVGESHSENKCIICVKYALLFYKPKELNER